MEHKRGQHPNSLANLRKFKPGQSGNPRGRPRKELCITSILQKKLGQTCDKDPTRTWAEWLALRALELAGENPAYYRELLERTEGKAGPRPPEDSRRNVNIYVIDEETKELMARVGDRTRHLPPPSQPEVITVSGEVVDE
ncbi:MAG: DUF5681 domain-containing protein [Dehalococcoidia bacterium]